MDTTFLNKISKISIVLVVIFAMSPFVHAQDDLPFVLEMENRTIQPDSCLNNTNNWNTFILVKKPEAVIESVTIEATLKDQKSNFASFNRFNDFDFKFWCLSNNAFKDGSSLKLEIMWIDDSGASTDAYFEICLEYIDPTTVDRGSGEPKYVKLPIYFATDRNKVNTDDWNEMFGNERSELKYGICQVSIPHDHKIGEIESPSIWRFEFTEDPEKHIMIHKVSMLEKDNFFGKLRRDIQATTHKRTFLFVHGYNTSFSDAAKRTAQISYDLLFDGKAVFYSWPSQASTFKYAKDETNIQWSQTNIRNFLEDYISRSGAEEIYLVAHSMGNRGLTRAIVDLMVERPELGDKIKEIILAAPDIDADVFKRDIAPKMVKTVKKPITLYVSSDDLALKASKELHGSPRAGDSGTKMVIVDGVETIDASGVDTSFLSHSYFADTSSIIADIFDLIKTGKRAVSRETLRLMKKSNSVYYKVKR
ncbi:MAG: alpha/beta hydrolase [Flavobacteriaceae bacterium]|nr:alpha/beta hydrolase [Flavobacteriaceae bacterium]